MPKALVIGYVLPEPDSSAAGKRMLQLLKFLRHYGYSVSFATTATPTEYVTDLFSLGIEIKKIRLNSSSFDEYVKDLDPELVLFDRFMMEEQFGWRVQQICPKALRILDTEDLHFLRNFREQALRKDLPFSFIKESELAKREIASIYRCDLSLIISETEMQLLKEEFKVPENLLFYLPFLLKEITSEEISELPGFQEREHFISIGNFRHKPNADAVRYLKQEIWPLIRKKLPQAQMHVHGAYAPAAITQLQDQHQAFLIKGRAENAGEVVKRARVSLAPIRFGAGLKGKLSEAMQYGTPTITTSTGAEAMSGSLPWNGVIADDPEEFARAAVDLYKQEEMWKEKQENGFVIINRRFSEKLFYPQLMSRLLKLQQQLQNHRAENFTGAMLSHHHHKSTYFLSKYIEVKNQLEQLQKMQKPPFPDEKGGS